MAKMPSKTGLAAKPKRKPSDDRFNIKYKPPVKGQTGKSRGKYKIGSHGFKKTEQKYLEAMFKIAVSGSTHESEHTIGYEPIARGLGEKRGHGETARRLENAAPAYQEVKQLHRDHIGTGTVEDRTGDRFETLRLTSTEYRQYQRTLLEKGRVGDAIQLNQMGYAFDPTSKGEWKKAEGRAASESYNRMIVSTDKIEYYDAGQIAAAKFSYQEKVETFVARKIVENRSYPDDAQLSNYREEFQTRWADRLMAEWKDKIDPVTGEAYSSYFDDVRRGREEQRKNPRSVSNDNASPASDPFTLKPNEEPQDPAARKAHPALPALDNNDNNNPQPDVEGVGSKRPLGADPPSTPFSLEEREAKKARQPSPAFGFESPTGAASASAHAAEPALPTPFEL